jgi:hypothetical protein
MVPRWPIGYNLIYIGAIVVARTLMRPCCSSKFSKPGNRDVLIGFRSSGSLFGRLAKGDGNSLADLRE